MTIKEIIATNKSNLIKEYAGLNHLFQHCTTRAVDEYAKSEETISPEVLADIANMDKQFECQEIGYVRGNDLKVIRNIDITVEVLSRFCGIFFYGWLKGMVLCVIENQVFHVQRLCQLAALDHRTVMFLIRMILITVTIQTESLTHQPVGTDDQLPIMLIVRLISKTCQTLTIRQ